MTAEIEASIELAKASQPDGPALPPGCWYQQLATGWGVMDARDNLLADAPTLERAAKQAWWEFGRFMTREELEQLRGTMIAAQHDPTLEGASGADS